MNYTHCPKCGKLGSPSLDNYCKSCDVAVFNDTLYKLCAGSVKVLNAAVAEVGAGDVTRVKREDRSRVINIIKRRKPVTRRENLVQATAPLESVGDAFIEPTGYNMEKGVPSIER